MTTYAVGITKELTGAANARGYLVAQPGASVLLKQDGVALIGANDVGTKQVFSDNEKTPMINPVPTGVAAGTAGVDTLGNLLVYLNPGRNYTATVTVGNSVVTVPLPDINLDAEEPIPAGAIEEAMLAFGVATQAELDVGLATKAPSTGIAQSAVTNLVSDLAGKQPTIPPGTYARAAQTFFVDDYLPAAPTPAQTLTAAQAAQDAAEAVGGVCKFTPGNTYLFGGGTFKIGTGTTVDFSGAYLQKTPGPNWLLVSNKDWAAGNPDITIIAHGATFDFDWLTQTAGNGVGNCIHLQNVDRLRFIGRPLVRRATKFAVTIGNADDIEVDGFHFDTRSDGLHCYPPMRRAKLGVFTGTTGDDFLAFTISDYAAQLANLAAGGDTTEALGDFEDIEVQALLINNDILATDETTKYGSGLGIIGGSGAHKVRRFHVGVIAGTGRSGGARITTDQTLTNLQVEDITIDKIAYNNYNTGSGPASAVLSIACTLAESVTIGEISTANTGAVLPVSVSGGHLKKLTINGFKALNSPTSYQILVAAAAQLDALHLRNVSASLTANGRLIQHAGLLPLLVTMDAFDVEGTTTGGWLLYKAADSGDVTLALGKGRLARLIYVCNIEDGRVVLTADGTVFDDNTQLASMTATASFRFLAGAITQTTAGDHLVPTSRAFSASGAQLHTDLARIDLAEAETGDMFFNTNAAALPGIGLVLFDGTEFIGPVGAAGATGPAGATGQVDTFTTPGATTVTPPAWATVAEVFVQSAGGGGGSGRRGAAGTIRCGGGAGGGGGVSEAVFNVADLPGAGGPINLNVGAGGTGGAAVTADDTSGNAGTAGGSSWFGAATVSAALVSANAGGLGTGGTAAAGTGGAGGVGVISGSAGGNASTTGLVGAQPSTGSGTGGGGSGGGITSADVASAGGAGGISAQRRGESGAAAGAIGAAGANATLTVSAGSFGKGGAGGGSSITGAGGAGGNGIAGGGGGGGGASLNGNNSGAGGNGANGIVRVVWRP